MFNSPIWFARAMAAVVPLAVATACGSATDADQAKESVSQTDSALTSAAEVTSVLTQGTRAAVHFLEDASDAVRGVRSSDCAKMTTRLVPRGVLVSASFESGCEIPALGSVSGTATMSLVVEAGAITFDVSYESFTLAGMTLTGTTSIVARKASTTVTMDLRSVVDERASHVVFDGTIVRDKIARSATIDASGSLESDSASTIPFTVAGLHVVLGACYADAGTLSIDPLSVKFLPSTPSDGAVELEAFGMTSTTTLPSYGRCPR